MEIITLVKAGLRNRKGIFIGFIILTALIVVGVVTMIGVSQNYDNAMKKAFDELDMGNCVGFFTEGSFDEELEKKITDSELVDHIVKYDEISGVHIECNGEKDGNGYYFTKLYDNIPVFNEDSTGFIAERKSVRIRKGEIFIPYGLKDRFKCDIGDKLEVDFLGISKVFIIRGFIQDPYMGSSIMGIKTVFINDEEFDELHEAIKANIKTEVDTWGCGQLIFVYPSDKANESSNIFLRDLNLETRFNDMAKNVMTRELSEHYTGIFINIIMAVITGFAILLCVIFLIVAGHNISTEMEIDYANLGILKSQGYTNSVIRRVYLIEYLIVQLVGIIVGFVISIPCERWLSKMFFGMTSILPEKKVPVMECLMLALGLFIVTSIYVFLFTRRVNRTSPVKAINGSKEDYYFESRLNMPITKKGLGFTLGLRQISSAPKRYISIFIVSALLIFSVISVELMSTYIESKNALIAMGEPFFDIEFAFQNKKPEYKVKDVEDIVEKYSEIESKSYKSHVYVSINGESVICVVKAYPEVLSSTYKGREVKYDNEVVITEQIAELLDVGIGDTISLGRKGLSEEYVITGIFQTMNDTGKAISVSLEGLSRLKKDPEEKYDIDQLSMYGLVLKDSSHIDDIVKEVKDKYGDDIEIVGQDFDDVMGQVTNNFYIAANASKIMIYVLTIIFALVTVMMVCTKAFIQERTDIGINRATGFSVSKIRRQFALRFMMIGLFSSVFGIIISRLFSAKMLESIFSMFGIPHIELEYNFISFAKPVIIFAVVYLIFGYLASGKVKKVSARELIVE